MNWRRINVPETVYNEIARVARVRGVAMWQVVREAITTFRAVRRQRKMTPVTDKVAWYVYKISSAAGEVRANPTSENKERFIKSIVKVSKRYDVDASEVISVVRRYDGSHSKRKVFNDVMKDFIMRLMEAIGEKE